MPRADRRSSRHDTLTRIRSLDRFSNSDFPPAIARRVPRTPAVWEYLREPHERRSGLQILLSARPDHHACNRHRVRRWAVLKLTHFRRAGEVGCAVIPHRLGVRRVGTQMSESPEKPGRFRCDNYLVSSCCCVVALCNSEARNCTGVRHRCQASAAAPSRACHTPNSCLGRTSEPAAPGRSTARRRQGKCIALHKLHRILRAAAVKPFLSSP